MSVRPGRPRGAERAVWAWIQAVFLNGWTLRAGFRLLGHVVLLGFGIVAMAAVGVGWALARRALDVPSPASGLLDLGVQAFTTCGVMLAVYLVSAWIFDARWTWPWRPGSLRGAGLALDLRGIAEFVGGWIHGALAIGVAVALVLAPGALWATPDPPPVWSWLYLVILIPAALFEELLFRGYLFLWLGASLARLIAWPIGRWWSREAAFRVGSVLGFATPVVGLAVTFGLLHLMNPSATWLSTTNTALAGCWFTVLVVRTRSVWPAFGAHLAWNTLLMVSGLPLSGLSMELGHALPVVAYPIPGGPAWWTGAAYGPEGGLATTVTLAIFSVLALAFPGRTGERGAAAFRPSWSDAPVRLAAKDAPEAP